MANDKGSSCCAPDTGESVSTFDSDVRMLLANRVFLYHCLSRAFVFEPDGALLDAASDNVVLKEACSLLDGDGDCGVELWGLISDAARARGALDELRGEYTRLFIGPNTPPVPPWESVFVSKDGLLFQESTLAVREAYRSQGFRAASYPHEPDDHLATELSFMAALSERTVRAFEEGDIDRCKELLSSQVDFLQGHLLVWIREFSDRLNEVDGISSFYPSFASLAALVCERDVEVIEELFAEL